MQGINFVFFLEKLPGPRLPAARPRTARPGPEIGCAAAAAAASPARSFFSPWPARDSERRPPCRRPCRAASPPLRSAFLSPPPPESPRSSSEDFFLVVVVLLLPHSDSGYIIKPEPIASRALTSSPNGEESGYGNSERDMTGWHCGTGSQGVDKPLPPGKKQTQSQGLPALAYIPHTCPNGV